MSFENDSSVRIESYNAHQWKMVNADPLVRYKMAWGGGGFNPATVCEEVCKCLSDRPSHCHYRTLLINDVFVLKTRRYHIV